jgi:hypothetical protein
MSLDVYLEVEQAEPVEQTSGIFIRRDGATVEITREEWDRLYPGRKPVVAVMEQESNIVYSSNITHNLGRMAGECGLYKPLWRPDEMGIKKAKELIRPLQDGLAQLNSDRDRLQEFNPENGWGDYNGLLQFTAQYLAACMRWPEAKVSVSR